MPLVTALETEQEQLPVAFEQMPLPMARGTKQAKQELLPMALEQTHSPTALWTEQEPLSMASK